MTSSKKTAISYALYLLSRADYSEAKIREKLAAKGYEEDEREGTVNRLKELKYLNDEETAAWQYRYLYEESKKSLREIEQKLLQKGFKKEDIEAAKPSEEDAYQRDLTVAKNALKSKYGKKKEPIKMRGYLYRHGFSSSVCYDAVREFLEEE